tara:strand:+ start:139 stop:552 length:414 start_codon:yes stop_codon:yes gene_type:complete
MKKKLKELFSDEIYLDFVDEIHVEEEKIIQYIHKWPDKFYSIFLKIQKNKIKKYEYVLPSKKETLIVKLNSKTKKIDVYIKKTTEKHLNKRFKELLKDVFKELKNEQNISEKMNSLEKSHNFSKRQLKEIDHLIKYI